MKKKIGILTFWGVPNYGAFAQAYALNNVISSLLPECAVEHIGYLHERHYALYFRKPFPKTTSIRTMLSPFYYKRIASYLLHDKSIPHEKFTEEWNRIPHRPFKNTREFESYHYDIIVTGSDSIWEYSIPDFGDDEHLIGNNLNADTVIAYAASFGNMNAGDSFRPFVSAGLRNYRHISVRDKVSENIIAGIDSTINASVVVDPVLLWDFKNDSSIPKSQYKNYILVYGSNFPEGLISDTRKYAEEHGLTIIGAGIAPEWCDIRLTEGNIGPKEWIGLFAAAEFVVTCTFHGLMFSLIHEKKFVFNQVDYVKNRSTSLLEDLGLYKLYKGGLILKDILDYEWNYDLLKSRLAVLRENSMNFLREALNDA